MNRILVAFFSLVIGLSVYAAAGFSSLEEQMTGKEFSAAGLDKLSKSELNELNSWIRSRSLATLEVASGTGNGKAKGKDVKEDDEDEDGDGDGDGDRTAITSKLVGKFSGWDGQTVFKLENGMIWAQADKDKFNIKEIENPTVVIEPAMFGKWRLRIDGYDSDCKVKRIQ